MKRMTADQTASGQPGALESTVPADGFERVLRARRREATARWQSWRNALLIPADEESKNAAGQLKKKHGSPGTQNRLAPCEYLVLERFEGGSVRLAARLDYQVPRRLPLLNLSAPDLSKATPQTITGHRGRLKLGNDQSHPRLAR
jgi:hypothetical protein